MNGESPANLAWRETVTNADTTAVWELCGLSGMFNPEEMGVAVELVRERLEKGTASGYLFWFAEEAGRVVGYACYGPIAGTAASWDLYWIVVHKSQQGRGLGSLILQRVEKSVGQSGGKLLWVETSGREVYRPTRAFYKAKGYKNAAQMEDFYAPGDHKVVFRKEL